MTQEEPKIVIPKAYGKTCPIMFALALAISGCADEPLPQTEKIPDTPAQTTTENLPKRPVEIMTVNPQIESSFVIKTRLGDSLAYSEMDQIWRMRNYPIEFSWMNEGEKITLDDDGRIIFGALWGDLIIVLYERNGNPVHPHPENLVIYHKDGREAAKVQAPGFKTSELLERNSAGTQGHMASLTTSDAGDIQITILDRDGFIEIQTLDMSTFTFRKDAKYGGRW